MGSTNSPLGNLTQHVIYAMEVTGKLTMADYDAYTKLKLPKKTPDWRNRDPRRRMGDSIYDFAETPPILRKGVHDEDQRKRDLSGEYALLSKRYIYFGQNAVKLPKSLLPIADCVRSHRSRKNDPYVAAFIRWISGKMSGKKVVGMPSGDLFRRIQANLTGGSSCRQ